MAPAPAAQPLLRAPESQLARQARQPSAPHHTALTPTSPSSLLTAAGCAVAAAPAAGTHKLTLKVGDEEMNGQPLGAKERW